MRENKKASFFKVIYIIFFSLCITLGYSIYVLYLSFINKLKRSEVDRYARKWSNAILQLAQISISKKGEFPEILSDRRYIIVCNHSSLYDIPVSFYALPGSIRMLAKKELFAVPIWGGAMKKAEFPSVDRYNRQQSKLDLIYAKKIMESGIMLWVAPEGTRSTDGKLQQFKKGSFRLAKESNAIIIPVAISNIHKVMPKKTFNYMLDVNVEVSIGSPIDMDQKENTVIKAMADSYNQIKDMLNSSNK